MLILFHYLRQNQTVFIARLNLSDFPLQGSPRFTYSSKSVTIVGFPLLFTYILSVRKGNCCVNINYVRSFTWGIANIDSVEKRPNEKVSTVSKDVTGHEIHSLCVTRQFRSLRPTTLTKFGH